MTDEKSVFLRKCQADGEIMVSVQDFVTHGIRHSDPYNVTREEFKQIQKSRRSKC